MNPRALRRRLAQVVPVVLLATFLVFGLLQLVPGDPAVTLAGESASVERIAEIRRVMGFDQPLLLQYWRWLTNALQGNLAHSLFGGAPVATLARGVRVVDAGPGILGELFQAQRDFLAFVFNAQHFDGDRVAGLDDL